MRGELAATGIELLVRRQVDDGRSARLGILERRDEPIEGRLIDDRGVVRAVQIGISLCDEPLAHAQRTRRCSLRARRGNPR